MFCSPSRRGAGTLIFLFLQVPPSSTFSNRIQRADNAKKRKSAIYFKPAKLEDDYCIRRIANLITSQFGNVGNWQDQYRQETPKIAPPFAHQDDESHQEFTLRDPVAKGTQSTHPVALALLPSPTARRACATILASIVPEDGKVRTKRIRGICS